MALDGSASSRVMELLPSQSATSQKVTSSAEARWYLIQTQPRAESRAIANLERQGYEIFSPRISKIVRHARKTTRILAPLFPGYVFVCLDISCEPWRGVNSTFGVARLITQQDLPQPVPRGVIETLHARTRSDGVIHQPASLKVGQTVRIMYGPFADLVGTLEQLDAAGRVRVLLDMLGRSVSVALGFANLSAAA